MKNDIDVLSLTLDDVLKDGFNDTLILNNGQTIYIMNYELQSLERAHLQQLRRDYIADRTPKFTPRVEPEEIHKQIFLRNCFVHSSVTFRRSVLIDLGGYNADFPQAQDYELFLRLSGHYKLSNLPEPLVRYRVHPNQVSLQKMASQRRLADKARAQAYKDQVNLGIAPHNAIKPDINYLSSLRGNAGTIGSDCFNWIDIYRTLNIKSTTNKLIIKSLLASPLSPRAWDEAIHLAKSVIFPQTIQNRLRWYKNKIFSMFPLRRK